MYFTDISQQTSSVSTVILVLLMTGH